MNALDYVSVEEAAALPGLRIAFSRGVPGPWGVGARAILEYKQIPFVAVPQIPGEANEALQRWTGQAAAPVAVYGEERPRASWSEIILLAERLAPEPRLIPADAAQRAEMFGLCHELCAEDGLGSSIRAMLFGLRNRDPQSLLVRRYDTGRDVAHARARANAVIALLAARLEAQAGRGSPYLVGEALSAADFYATAFSHLLRGFPVEICEMPDSYRTTGDLVRQELGEPPEILFAHRDRILRDHMRCPFRF
jgi:glutathione S-transferase